MHLHEGRERDRFPFALPAVEPIENVPHAFLRLLTSRNLGKQLVRIAPEP